MKYFENIDHITKRSELNKAREQAFSKLEAEYGEFFAIKNDDKALQAYIKAEEEFSKEYEEVKQIVAENKKNKIN